MRRPTLRFAAIAAVAALLIVTPVALLATLTSATVDQSLAARDEAERRHAVDVAGRLVDTTLESAGESLQLLALRVQLREALEAGDREALSRHLSDLRSVSALYASAEVLAPDGTLLARDPDVDGGHNLADLEYFRGANASVGPFVSEVYRSPFTPFGPVVAVSYAVRDGQATLGVLQLALAPADVLRPLRPVTQLRGRTLVVADDADRVIASTDDRDAPLDDARLGSLRGASGSAASFRAVVHGVDRFVTPTGLRAADWTLYLLDEAAVVLAVERELSVPLERAAGVTGAIAVVLGILLAFLYEKLVRQRDALAVARNDLASVNAALQSAGQNKSEFLANMSHELRTPLNAILGFSQLLEEQLAGALSDRQRRYLGNIHAAGAHLLALIGDVLDLSKVEAGHMELRPERITFASVVDPVVSAAQEAADARGVLLETTLARATLEADAGRMRQILYNLLSNAIKFTPRGGRVSLRTWTSERDLHAEVADSGIGIPADRQSLVFGVFQRVNEDRAETEGTGLGLTLTRRLVELHGGSISFTSQEDVGTTFRVTLPGIVREPRRADTAA